ncbi:MAG: class I SAM-dependent methyltransferase [Victivallales bacterium]
MKKLKGILAFPFRIFYHYYNYYAFLDSPIGIFFNPFYLTRRALLRNIRELGKHLHGCLLDVGCGSKPYEKWIQADKYIGLEYVPDNTNYSGKADYIYDGHKFPFPDKFFDTLLSSQVLEHVFNPDEFLSEINRCLKNDGIFLLTVPFIWDEHEKPQDFGRYTSFGVRHLLQEHGFKIIEQRKTCNNIRVIFQLWNSYLFKTLKIKNLYLHTFCICMLTFPSNIAGILLSFCLPINPDLYLDNIILAQKIKDLPTKKIRQ